jgi:opine dehydrogenase
MPAQSSKPRVICILGAGNLGLAQAGHLSALGHQIRLFNRSPRRLEALGAELRIELQGALSLRGKVALATTDLAEAVRGAELIFVDVPAPGHASLAAELAPILAKDSGWDPLVILHPGQSFGSLHFARRLKAAGLARLPRLCEIQTALYTTRASGPAKANVLAMKKDVVFAPLPHGANGARELTDLYDVLRPVQSTLHTALTNLPAFVHPAICLFNLTRLDRAEPFRLYREGLTPSVGACIERADEERVRIAGALGVDVPTGIAWFGSTYGINAPTIAEAMWKVSAYDSLMGPDTLATRMLWEDVPSGLAPLSALAHALGVAAPTLDALLALAVSACGPSLLASDWSLESLGLAGLNASQIREVF